VLDVHPRRLRVVALVMEHEHRGDEHRTRRVAEGARPAIAITGDAIAPCGLVPCLVRVITGDDPALPWP
jgi:hypothetical protein